IRFGTYGRGVWDFEITSSPLPAELIAFTALPEGKDAARLDWVTASEIGTKEFIIAHSEDGTQFKAIGSVAAAGWSQATQEYHFIHQDLQTQKNYYRLEMVEEDHSVEYSEIRVVSLDALSTAFAVFPNPVAQNSALSIRTAFEGDYRLEIYDGNGRMVYTEVLREQEATLSVDLAKGLYWVNLVDNRGQKTLQKKLVVF
ncbi:MAG: T9SS type A sorting domain-containing protein, partial [Bacteroidota bacterium]